MEVKLVTREDLERFKMDLLSEIRQLITSGAADTNKPWIKQKELQKLLGVSASTIQRLRIKGKLKSIKLGGTHYYSFDNIQTMLNG